jgi:hypothetical protein
MRADAAEETKTTGNGDFDPAPRGIYTLQVADYSQDRRTTGGKNPGTPYTSFTCEIADQGPFFGKRVWHTVVWIQKGEAGKPRPGHGLCVRFLHAVGMAYDGALNFDEADFQGRTFRALLEVEPYVRVVNGKSYTNHKNVVRELYTENHPEPAELPPPQVPKAAKPGTEAAKTAGVASDAQDLEEAPF